MSRAHSPSASKPYGLVRVCDAWGVPRSTVYHRRQLDHREGFVAKKRGPKSGWSDEDLVVKIREVLEASPQSAEGYRKAWARLRHAEIRTAPRRVLRLMRENCLLAPMRREAAIDCASRQPKNDTRQAQSIASRKGDDR